jgi:hypothetical protein
MNKSNWAVGEAYKMNTNHDPRKRNIHDPENQYVWADEGIEGVVYLDNASTRRTVGFITGIYCLVFLGMLL